MSPFDVGNPIDDLGVHDHRTANDQVGNVVTNNDAFVDDLISFLLIRCELTEAELDPQRILVGFLVQPVTQLVQDLHCATDDGKGELGVRSVPFVSIRVHLWF